MDTATADNPTTDNREPVIALPWRPVVVAAGIASVAVALGWLGVTRVLGETAAMSAGPAGAALVLVLSVGSLLALGPWKPRPVGTWVNLWMAGIVGRLFVTPAVAFLLYSATPLALSPLMLAVAATYVVVQIVEAATLAAHLKTPSPAPAASPES